MNILFLTAGLTEVLCFMRFFFLNIVMGYFDSQWQTDITDIYDFQNVLKMQTSNRFCLVFVKKTIQPFTILYTCDTVL